MGVGGTAARKLTYDHLVAMPDDGLRHELIDGVHYVSPAPRFTHQRVLGNVFFLLASHTRSHGGGKVCVAPLDIVFSQHDVVEPDVMFISDRRIGIITDANLQGAPDLLVEIASPSTRRRDEGIKLGLYDRTDVTEYWFVDPDAEYVRIYRRPAGTLELVGEVRRAPGAVLETPLLPGLTLPLDEVFRE